MATASGRIGAGRDGLGQAQLLDLEGYGDHAAASHVDLAVGAHQIDELVQLLGVAGSFEREALDGRIDDARAEDLSLFQNRRTAFEAGPHAQENHLAGHRGAFRQVACLQDVDELVDLFDDLGADLRVHIHHDGHAGQLGIERAGDRQAFDVVATGAEQAGDAQQRAGFVLEQDGDDLQHVISSPRRVEAGRGPFR